MGKKNDEEICIECNLYTATEFELLCKFCLQKFENVYKSRIVFSKNKKVKCLKCDKTFSTRKENVRICGNCKAKNKFEHIADGNIYF